MIRRQPDGLAPGRDRGCAATWAVRVGEPDVTDAGGSVVVRVRPALRDHCQRPDRAGWGAQRVHGEEAGPGRGDRLEPVTQQA